MLNEEDAEEVMYWSAVSCVWEIKFSEKPRWS